LFSGTGTIQIPKFPKLGLLYDTDKIKTQELFKTDKTNHYGITADYSPTLQKAWVPRTISLGYKVTKENLDFDQANALLNASDPFSVSDTHDDTREITARMSFQPKLGFSFTPNFYRSVQRESKDAIFPTMTVVGSTAPIISTTTLDYDKLKTQTMGF